DYYYFPEKKLDAYWYAPPEERFPRIFISELRVKDLSESSRAIIEKYTGSLKADPVDAIDLNDTKAVDLFLHSSLWETPTVEDYEALAGESE
ncbi:2-oxoadipate dioxygenase/decarboxylase family protein, partial [Salmonella enterica]|uniref:2-oxoadipate dioxygenase/decarboxylase family protein n=1 Tax=Salmonella enterica TaxID=28901 RepID=UPI0020A5BE2E